MEPKDLKNSEELKRTEAENAKLKDVSNDKLNKPEANDEVADVENNPTEKEEEMITAVEEEKETSNDIPETKVDPVEEKPQEETAAETPIKEEADSVKETEKPTAKEEIVEEVTAEAVQPEKAETPVVEPTDAKEEAKPEKEEKEEAPAESVDAEDNEKSVETPEKEIAAKKEEKPAEETASEEAEKPVEETKDAEKVIKEKVAESVDYSKYTQIELVNALRDILDENDGEDIKQDVENIKAVFYKNLNDNIQEAREKFIEGGGNEEEFKAEDDPYENDIKDLLKRYRQIRIDINRKMEGEKEENLQKKYDVIEKIKGLINNEESINKTFNEFRDLQKEWRDIGLVPQAKMKDLWDTYHFHVENFYDYIKINRELRDLDLKKNLESKIRLCERAEELLLEPSVIKAFNTLQKYHEQWREIGPVPREQKDDIWERFKAATAKINKKHQDFYENRKVEQKKNLEAKTALCEKVEDINIEEIENHKDWDEKSKELVELQKLWRTIGFAPRKDNNKIYDRFRTACDKFFNAKRDFYAKNKEFQQNNLQLKIDLCVQAEALKDSTDWKKTTQDLINIQKQWKDIGPVPRKHSDNIWKRFRGACDYFFDKKSEHFSGLDSEQDDNLKEKEKLVDEITNFKPSEDVDQNLNKLKEFQRRWTEIGHVPFKNKDDIQNRFREAINKLYDELNINEDKRNMLKFRTKMSSFSESSRGQNKMRFERDKYMNKMKQLENDLVLLDNNIGFFAKSKSAESLIADVKKKIEITKRKIETLKDKIRVIDEMDQSDE